MRLALLIILLVFPTLGDSSVTIIRGTGSAKPITAAGGATYLLNESFDTNPGYDLVWVEQAGTPDEDYTATILEGSQSLRLNGSAATQSADSPNFVDQTTIYGFFRLWIIAYAGADREIMRLQLNAAQSGSAEIRLDADGDLTIQHAAGSYVCVDNMATGTSYDVWFTLDASGAGYAEICFAAAGAAKPTSGNKFVSNAATGGTALIDQVRCSAQFSTSGADIIIDKLRIDDAAIGSNPP